MLRCTPNRLAVRGTARLAGTRQLTAAAAPHIVIDIVSDIRCPWCFIGKRRLERAIRSIPPTAATFEVKWFPYMLDDELTAEGDRVRLVLTHRRLAEGEEITGACAGWHTHLGILEDRLAGRTPDGFWRTHTRLEAEYEQQRSRP